MMHQRTQCAVVVFCGNELVHDPSWYVRLLKTGFVHCFMLIKSGNKWIKIEGANGMVSITYLGQIRDVAEHYRSQGAICVETRTTLTYRANRYPFVPRTCVGLIKSVLGIRSMALTPFQLYKHIVRS
jgi:hypothetical protein